MTNKLKRLKGGKGPRWKKGQSCLSNATKTSFREAAKGRFFQEVQGESSLTQDALAKHNNQLADVPAKFDTQNVEEEDYQSVGKSFNTFATNFTTCTIPAFEKFFQNFSVESSVHTRMLAIHAAAQEYIQDANLPETSTSYFCALISSLEGVKESEEDVAATLSLLARVIRKVSNDILVANFGTFAALIYDILKCYESSRNNTLLANAIGCLSIALRAQSKVEWQYESTKNLFNVVRHYTLHGDSKIRKSAQYNVSAILKGSSFMLQKNNDESMDEKDLEEVVPVQFHPAAESIAKFLKDELQMACQSLDAKKTLHILTLSQQVVYSFPEKLLQQVCERILGVMMIGEILVRNVALKTFQSLFSPHRTSALTAEVNEGILNALTLTKGLERCLVPNVNDEQLAISWIKVCTHGLAKLLRFDQKLGIEHMVRWSNQVTTFWRSNSDDVHEEVFFSLEFLLDDMKANLGPKLYSEHRSECVTFFQPIEKGLSLQYKEAWPYVFRTLAASFKTFGPQISTSAINCLKSLSELYEDPELAHRPLLELAIGSAIAGLGPEIVMEVIPLKITGNVLEDERFFWMLPVLKRYTKNVQLSFFATYFLHLADKCALIVSNLIRTGKGSSVITTTYKQIELQIWALFPCFADGATDTEHSLSVTDFPKRIRDNIKDREDIRLDILSGLRNMINSRGTPSKLSQFAKNFLPVMFNIYLMPLRENKAVTEGTVDSGQRLAVYDTIKLYLSITNPTMATQLFGEALKKYNTEVVEKLKELNNVDFEDLQRYEIRTTEFKGRCLLDLFRIHLPYIPTLDLESVWKIIRPFVVHSHDIRQQKGAYRILEEMLELECEAGKQFLEQNYTVVKDTLLGSMKTVAANARSSRLNCLNKMLIKLPSDIPHDEADNLLRQIVSEAIICFGSSNSAPTKKSAIKLIILVGQVIQSVKKTSTEETFCQTLSLLLAGLAAKSSPAVISSTVKALAVLSCKYHELMPLHMLQNLLENVSLMLRMNDRDVSKSALSFIKVMFSVFPPSTISNQVDKIVGNMLEINEDCRKKHRMKIRDIFTAFIRKFGADRIKNLIPEKDVIATKSVKNIAKAEARKKKQNKKEKSDDDKPDRVIPASLDEILEEIDRELEDDEETPAPAVQKDNREGTKKTKKKKKLTWLKEEEDEIMDLLDASTGRKSSKPIRSIEKEEYPAAKKSDEEKYGFKFDKNIKKFIIKDDRGHNFDEQEDDSDNDSIIPDLEGLVIDKSRPGKKVKRKRTLSNDSDDDMEASTSHKPSTVATKKKSKFDYGSEFRSKKAGGDVRSKAGMVPYAYVPLTKEKLNKRKQSKFKGQFKSLIRGAQKGAAKGSKGSKGRKQNRKKT